MLPLRWLRRLMAILHVCLSVLHARMHTLGGFGFACIAQGENLHEFTLTLTCNSHLGNSKSGQHLIKSHMHVRILMFHFFLVYI